MGQVNRARDVIQEDHHHHCDACEAGWTFLRYIYSYFIKLYDISLTSIHKFTKTMEPLSIAGHGVFDAVPDGGAVPLLRAATQPGR